MVRYVARAIIRRLPKRIHPTRRARPPEPRRLLGAWLLIIVWTASGCAGAEMLSIGSDNILLWHSWPPAEAKVLQEVLKQVDEISPGVEVIDIFVARDEIVDRYIESINEGIGPDLLIGAAEWLPQLIATESVRPIPNDTGLLLEFRDSALDAVRVGETLYGIPMSVAPNSLYVNLELAGEIPSGIDDFLDYTSVEAPVALEPRFEPAYWGIADFGVGLFDSQGRFTLTTSGFTEWLTWLESVQDEPGIILNSDSQALLELFMEGRAAYYVGGPEELSTISRNLSEDKLAVVRLPNGPVGPAGPLVAADAVMLGTNSSDTQAEAARVVAALLTNRQQSTTFMRELGRIPANAEVSVDPRIYPLLGGFARQSATSVALPNDIDQRALAAAGNRAYANVLSGLMTPEEAICRFGWEAIDGAGVDEEEADLPDDCERPIPPAEE